MNNSDITKRSFLQATYTPIKTKEGLSDKGGRGIEKCAFVSQLNPTKEELKKLKEKYGANNRNALVAVVEILINIISQSEEIAGPYCAKYMAEVEAELLLQVARDVLNMRQNVLEEILASYEEFLKGIRKGLTRPIESMSANEVLNWAITNNFHKDLATMIINLARLFNIDLRKVKFEGLLKIMIRKINQFYKSLTGLKETMKVLPVGYLHLERLSFTPAGTEKGELVYSVPLSPGEEVNITHREWSHTTEEYEKIVTDYLEDFSEEGVTEKSELAESVSTQDQHSKAFNTGVSASGEYGGVNISASIGYNASESASESVEISRNQSAELTHKASSRSKKEHKLSFKVSSAAETEEMAVRKIKNPFSDRAARVDYYQFMRKWKVELFRYGIRLTWDITIPEPGSGILAKLKEMRELQNELNKGFDEVFTLKPTDIDLDNYEERAGAYGVPVTETAPPRDTTVLVQDSQDWHALCGGGRVICYALPIVIPDGYEVTGSQISYIGDPCAGQSPGGWGMMVSDLSGSGQLLYNRNGYAEHTKVNNFTGWNGRTGQLGVWLKMWDVKVWGMAIRVNVTLTDSAFSAWRQKTWQTIRDGYQDLYYAKRQMLKERLAQLEEEIKAQDALTLRKREREEVMKGVLRWLDIQGFTFYPPGIPQQLEPTEEGTGVYSEETGLVIGDIESFGIHGEKIKFLHHAIEWENMLYFLYPYFWTHPSNWEDKKYLDYPDPLHRTFLKAGSARVVLTIRPGFEDPFMAFLNTGEMDQLPPSPYLEIGQEFKNYANTNYPGIPPANPVENYRPLLYPAQRQAWEDMQKIMLLLERYHDSNNYNYPTTAQGLNVLNAYTGGAIPTVPKIDPWGNNYIYSCPGIYGEYDLVSYGRDGNPGGEGEDADITNYAEASLIGQWYEYTPTSALDISFEPKPMTEGIEERHDKTGIPTVFWIILTSVSVLSLVAIILSILGLFTR